MTNKEEGKKKIAKKRLRFNKNTESVVAFAINESTKSELKRLVKYFQLGSLRSKMVEWIKDYLKNIDLDNLEEDKKSTLIFSMPDDLNKKLEIYSKKRSRSKKSILEDIIYNNIKLLREEEDYMDKMRKSLEKQAEENAKYGEITVTELDRTSKK